MSCSMDVEDTAEETQSHPKRRPSHFPLKVLEIEGRLLKAHRKRLLCSFIFGDILALLQPLDADQVDDVLPGDIVAAWLAWMYHTDEFLNQPSMTFNIIISGALRIATKYEIGALHAWAPNNSRRAGRPTSRRCASTPCPTPPAIAIARECHTPQILPSAFYALSVLKFHRNADGGRSHLVLGPADLRRLIARREALQDELIQILIDPLHEGGCSPRNKDPIHEDGSPTPCTHCTPPRVLLARTPRAGHARAVRHLARTRDGKDAARRRVVRESVWRRRGLPECETVP
ncbi:hypothetical protein C8J57DRAFT_1712819 [Mycena rebaudengoi]|nr:hypothetical protein C8J57DRAFT_1712819 [Mycena rebaudengoi]